MSPISAEHAPVSVLEVRKKRLNPGYIEIYHQLVDGNILTIGDVREIFKKHGRTSPSDFTTYVSSRRFNVAFDMVIYCELFRCENKDTYGVLFYHGAYKEDPNLLENVSEIKQREFLGRGITEGEAKRITRYMHDLHP